MFGLGHTIDIDRYVSLIQEWVGTLGPWAQVGYVLSYVLATLVFLPGTPFTILAAILFGPWRAFGIMMVATTASAIIAFVVARYLAKRIVERHLADMDSFRRLLQIVEENPRFALPFIRFLPVFPYSFNNCALGLTNVSFRSYLLWSEMVFVVMNAVLVLGAGALYGAMIRGEVSWGLVAGSTGAGVLVLLFGYMAKRHLGASAKHTAPAPS